MRVQKNKIWDITSPRDDWSISVSFVKTATSVSALLTIVDIVDKKSNRLFLTVLIKILAEILSPFDEIFSHQRDVRGCRDTD